MEVGILVLSEPGTAVDMVGVLVLVEPWTAAGT